MKKAPTDNHLKHKAIISTIDYHHNDGPYRAADTDVVALSLGKSTWNNEQISAKVWRHTGEKWSRESEDLPLHRALDLTILILSAYLSKDEVYENHFLDLDVVDHDSLNELQAYLEDQRIHLDERFHEIKLLLKKYFTNR